MTMFSRRPAAADRGPLGPGADQRVAGAHEHGPGPHDGLRDLDDPDLSPADGHLKHVDLLDRVETGERAEPARCAGPDRVHSAITPAASSDVQT